MIPVSPLYFALIIAITAAAAFLAGHVCCWCAGHRDPPPDDPFD